MKTNNTGIELIKYFEGFSPTMYTCPAGYRTIGYGHRQNGGIKHPEYYDTWTPEDFENLLRQDLIIAENAVNKLIIAVLNENQFSALVSFVYNLGSGRLQSSTLRAKLNRGEYSEVPKELLKWCRAGGKELKGLKLRRQAEATLFELPI